MKNNRSSLNTVLSLIAIILAVIALVSVYRPVEKEESREQGEIQYVMYLGTNDKDTNQPRFTPEEAQKAAETILLKHFGGYTIQEANGGWIDDNKVYQEYTLVIYLSDTTPDQVHAAADEMLKIFNQSSVLIQANKTETEFYSGE